MGSAQCLKLAVHHELGNGKKKDHEAFCRLLLGCYCFIPSPKSYQIENKRTESIIPYPQPPHKKKIKIKKKTWKKELFLLRILKSRWITQGNSKFGLIRWAKFRPGKQNVSAASVVSLQILFKSTSHKFFLKWIQTIILFLQNQSIRSNTLKHHPFRSHFGKKKF